jgi:hypothetical protein
MGLNIIISKNKKYYYLEGFNIKKKDSFDKLIILNKNESSKESLKDKKKFCKKIEQLQQNILTRETFYSKPKKNYFDNKTIKKIYSLHNFFWEDNLIHNILNNNIKISKLFKLFVKYYPISYYNPYNKKNKNWSISKKSKIYTITKNQMLVFDALMVVGGMSKKYTKDDPQNNNKISSLHDIMSNNSSFLKKYSEHSGLIDFDKDDLRSYIINNDWKHQNILNQITDKSDDSELFFPESREDAIDYEIIFHTHPETPYIGMRMKEDGVIYELPSVSDLKHFIYHYNKGITQGELVFAPEGIYLIRASFKDNKKNKLIFLNEDELEQKMWKLQDIYLKKYFKKYLSFKSRNKKSHYFLSSIAQDRSFILKYNKYIENLNNDLYIDYYPKIFINNKWSYPSINLVINYVDKKS